MNRALVALAVAALGLFSAPRPGAAQVARADSAAVLLAAAADLEQDGERDAAATLYRHIAARFSGTPSADAAFAWLEAAAAELSSGSGETELKVWGTTYGIWLGLMVPLALSPDGPEPYGAGLLIGAPGGFFLARALTRSRPLSLGQVRAITWGGTWGALQGLALAGARDVDGDAVFGYMAIGSGLGLAGGLAAARREITPGTATSASLGSLWGAWFGLASSLLMDFEGDETWVTMMLAGNAGLIGGALAGSRWPLSRSRARMISVGGLIGGVGGLGVVLLAHVDNQDPAIGIALTGSVLGLVVGGALTRGSDAAELVDGTEAGHSAPTPALVNRSRGNWSLGLPLPTPVSASSFGRDGKQGPAARGGLVWRVPLLHLRF